MHALDEHELSQKGAAATQLYSENSILNLHHVHWSVMETVSVQAAYLSFYASCFQSRLTGVVSFRPYSVYLLTAGDAELAGAGAPLPPPELYNGRRPQAGLLPLLTAALWQVLWLDAAPGAGKCVPPSLISALL